ncbi:hypothetical protein SCH01S_45_01110 [Sphingomonas changbaiensis NBRC 104936]|uniref:5-bromo-4-chloroindolyl phosphate hydrolysis protein n=1 Tax=Sphingomonas changbaiensis NBRC 104936 TaxID=1219043 RepID=A0A0E9MS00_9SPHN|nr:hypothetical protein [Sphingomonas changbaiensis]GAO40268.1 hypothetical protein SCH01S_45_01110 [Sphingomonas changbaiensis NBRC 104936]
MIDSDLIISKAEELIRRASPEGRAAARRRRERRKQRAVRMMRRMFLLTLAILVAAVAWGLIIGPIGGTGVMAVALGIVLSWVGTILFTAEPEARAEQLPQVPLKALPNRTEQWLDTQRPALPAPANRLIDQIGVRLDGLAPCVQHLDEREPAAMEVRRLVGEELPELVRGYQRVPQQLRRQGPDAQLVEGLRVVESELARMTQQLASGDLDKLATQGKYLELKYRGAEE